MAIGIKRACSNSDTFASKSNCANPTLKFSLAPLEAGLLRNSAFEPKILAARQMRKNMPEDAKNKVVQKRSP